MLSLGDRWATFEANSTPSDVFYDDGCQKICTVANNGACGVTVKGLDSNDVLKFQMKDNGKIKVIKFSPDNRTASVQREGSSIGLELYQVNSGKKNVKLLKTCNILLSWGIYYGKSQLLVISTGVSGSKLIPFLIQNNNIYRLAEFEVDFGCSNTRATLSQREVSIASVYGNLYVTVFRYNLKDASVRDVSLYKVSGDVNEKSSLLHTLPLGMTGPFAIHVLDNIVVVHHQVSCSSLLFDLKLENQTSGVCSHQPIATVSLSLSANLRKGYIGEIPLYSPYWVMFPHNLVVDTSAGLFATLSIHPEKGESCIKDNLSCLHFLFNRSSSKNFFLDYLRLSLMKKSLTLKNVSFVFSWIFDSFRNAQTTSKINENNAKYSLIVDSFEPLKIDQNDIIGSVLLPAVESNSADKQFLVRCMLHYLQGLQENSIDTLPFFLNEVLVPTMVVAKEFNRLQQLLQYRVIPDAKQLAFFLLSHEAKHGPLIQLAVDMLARLGTAAEEIVEVLLSKGHVVEAIRYLEANSSVDKVNSLKLLEFAWKENRQIQYAVFTYFQKLPKARNNNLAGAEQYEQYVQYFNELFEKEEIEEAKHASQFSILLREEKLTSFQNL